MPPANIDGALALDDDEDSHNFRGYICQRGLIAAAAAASTVTDFRRRAEMLICPALLSLSLSLITFDLSCSCWSFKRGWDAWHISLSLSAANITRAFMCVCMSVQAGPDECFANPGHAWRRASAVLYAAECIYTALWLYGARVRVC